MSAVTTTAIHSTAAAGHSSAAATHDAPLLEVRDIRKVFVDRDFQTPVLKGVNFTLNRGEMVAMLGPSGSGKSTLLSILGTLMRPTSGSFRMQGRELTAIARNRADGFSQPADRLHFSVSPFATGFLRARECALPACRSLVARNPRRARARGHVARAGGAC